MVKVTREISRGFYTRTFLSDYLKEVHFKHYAVNLWMKAHEDLILQKLNFYEISLLFLLNKCFRYKSQTASKPTNVKRKLSKQKLWLSTIDN